MPLSSLLSILLLCVCFFSHAQQWTQIGTGSPIADFCDEDHFGFATAMHGNVAVVAAPDNDDHSFNGGKVLVYEKGPTGWTQQAVLFSPVIEPNQGFGRSVAIGDDVIFVGAPWLGTDVGPSEGVVFVFKKSGGDWIFTHQILANDRTELANFGTSLAYDGTLLAVGARGAIVSGTTRGGAVYLVSDPTSEPQELNKIVVESEQTSNFGTAVAFNSQYLFAADEDARDGFSLVGAVFVFERSTGQQIAKFTPSNSTSRFGVAVSATEDAVAIGALNTTNGNDSYGTAYLFLKPNAGWSDATEDIRFPPREQFQIYGRALILTDEYLMVGSDAGVTVDIYEKPISGWAPDLEPVVIKKATLDGNARFGYALATNGTDLFVGTPYLTLPDESSGVVFVYEKSAASWSSVIERQALYAASISASGDRFGTDVDISGNYAVVGAREDDTFGRGSGAAYVFERQGITWTRVAKLTASDAKVNDAFGAAVAIEGNTIVVSAAYANRESTAAGSISGRVYVFDKPAGGWANMHETSSITRIEEHEGTFGYDVDISNDEIVVSHYRGGSSGEIGVVQIFSRQGNSWKPVADLSPSNIYYTGFGNVVAYEGDILVISAPGTGLSTGIALLYERPLSGWTSTTELVTFGASDGQKFNSFGSDIDIEGTTVVITSRQPPTGGTGAAYIFEKGDGWTGGTEDAKLTPSALTDANARLGRAVALSDDYAVVTMNNVYHTANRLFFFRKTNGVWQNSTEYEIRLPSETDFQYGYDLAMDGNHLIVGIPEGTSDEGNGSGLVRFLTNGGVVTEVNSDNADGTYLPGDKVDVKVVFSESIKVTGTPSLKLTFKDGGTKVIPLKSVTDQEMHFEYTVAPGDFSDDLDYYDINSLILDGPVTTALGGFTVATELPLPGSPSSLSGRRDLVINGEVITSIEETSTAVVSVYPNPFVTGFTIATREPISFTLTSVDGKVWLSGDVQEEEYFTWPAGRGMYIFRALTRDGRQINAKLVKTDR